MAAPMGDSGLITSYFVATLMSREPSAYVISRPASSSVTSDPVADLAGLGSFDDGGVAQLDGELVDAALVLRLLLARGLVTAILRQIALGAGCRDALGDFLAVLALSMRQLILQRVESLLRQQNGFFLTHGFLLYQ